MRGARNTIYPSPAGESCCGEIGSVGISARSHDASAGDPGIAVTSHLHVDALKVGAQQNRSRGIRRSGQETLGAPQIQVMTDQKAVAFLFPSAFRHGLHFSGNGPWRATYRDRCSIQSRGHARYASRRRCVPAPRVEQCLAAAVPMILDAVSAAAIIQRAVIRVAEPSAVSQMSSRWIHLLLSCENG